METKRASEKQVLKYFVGSMRTIRNSYGITLKEAYEKTLETLPIAWHPDNLKWFPDGELYRLACIEIRKIDKRK